MKFLGIVAVIVGIIGGLLGIRAYFTDPGTPDENQAQLFLESYYATASEDPRQAWQMTTTSYREQHLVEGLRGYVHYWRTDVRSASVDDFGISRDPQRHGWWKARVTFVLPNGKPSQPYFEYQLLCSWQSNLPWNKCDHEHVLLNKARQYHPEDYAK